MTELKPLANGKIQGIFKAFECFSSTFQGKFYFQGLFKTVLYIQVLFKPVGTLTLVTIHMTKAIFKLVQETNKSDAYQIWKKSGEKMSVKASIKANKLDRQTDRQRDGVKTKELSLHYIF